MTTATWRKLEATRKVRCDRRPVPAYSGSGKRIVVSRTQNYVWLVRSDGTVRWQGGIIDNPSVWSSGTYRTGSVCGRPAHVRYNSDYSGTLRLDHFTRLRTNLCGVGFHRIPVRKSNGAQIHADWLLGTNLQASHGCMRVSARTASEIWDFTQSAVTVVVKP
ncbi:L,D-transpeptidase [Nocardioides sp.]|uniref:L,D-transpeptidase n=1 Tax=Nocardioides sp. TaxID=35761 RepID=UPI002C160732|nr:L,D-transpeptidase [Nocardioides sp.]HSX66838.1 L,D-transpeptidase [Nocardioides sp.]